MKRCTCLWSSVTDTHTHTHTYTQEEYDDLLSLYENISRGKYMLKLTDEDVTFTTSLLIEAGLCAMRVFHNGEDTV